jgi:hypothetical protein
MSWDRTEATDKTPELGQNRRRFSTLYAVRCVISVAAMPRPTSRTRHGQPAVHKRCTERSGLYSQNPKNLEKAGMPGISAIFPLAALGYDGGRHCRRNAVSHFARFRRPQFRVWGSLVAAAQSVGSVSSHRHRKLCLGNLGRSSGSKAAARAQSHINNLEQTRNAGKPAFEVHCTRTTTGFGRVPSHI